MNRAVMQELQQIPGVGKIIAQDLWELGIHYC
jgi:predicted flap endonuclease-1-like 5' DNA nuclease